MDDDHEEFFQSVIMRVYRLFSAVIIGIIACMPFVFPLLINENYRLAYFQIPIYMIATLFNVVQGLYSVIYVALKKTKEIAKTTVVSAIINIIVNLVLIKYIGLYAASISSLVAYGINTVWRYFDLKKYVNVRMQKSVLISSIIALVIVCIGYYSENHVACVSCLIFAIIYSIVINRDILILVMKSPNDIKKIVSRK